ncbi:unnamed protein product, partial [Laminaria digitata]
MFCLSILCCASTVAVRSSPAQRDTCPASGYYKRMGRYPFHEDVLERRAAVHGAVHSDPTSSTTC